MDRGQFALPSTLERYTQASEKLLQQMIVKNLRRDNRKCDLLSTEAESVAES